MGSQFLTGLDIGTSALKVAVVERRSGRCVLRSLLKEASLGMRKGALVEPAELDIALEKAFESIRKVSRGALKNIYVNIGTPQIKVQHSRGIVAVSRVDNEIYQDDIDRVVRASEAVNLAPNRMIVHNMTREFVVDGVADIGNPLGLSGSRLEVASIIVDAFAPHVKGIVRAVETAGGEVSNVVFSPLAASRAALTKNQKELGCALVDIGFGTTSLAVYEENKILGLQAFPVGSGNITNDIAVGLKIPVGAAEGIKLHSGFAIAREVGAKESIDVQKFFPEASGTISRRFIAEIIESRMSEILQFVENELSLLGKSGRLAGGIVFTGGGSKLPGLTELAKSELRLASQIGFAIGAEWLQEGVDASEHVEDPEFVNALGLVLWGGDEEHWWREKTPTPGFSIRDFFKRFLP